MFEKIKPYLPSKEFTKKVGIIFGGILLVVLLVFALKGLNAWIKKKMLEGKIKNIPVQVRDKDGRDITLGGLLDADSNTNGIPDWEEKLWGLDPYASGEGNKKIIEEKRAKILIETGVTPTSEENLNSTDKFSREFLALVLSLQMSGGLNEEAIQNIATNAGYTITDVVLPDKAGYFDLRTVQTDSVTTEQYFSAVSRALNRIPNLDIIGQELAIVAKAVQSENEADLIALGEVIRAYELISEGFLDIPVPEAYASNHLAIINGAHNVAESITGMQQIFRDPIRAVQGFMQYKVYTESLNLALDELGA